MERFIIEFGLRSVLIAGAAALVLLVLKIRAAAPQHRIWTGVLVVMLALPVWIQWGPKAALPILPSPEPAIFTNALAVQTVRSAIPVPVEMPTPTSNPSIWSWETVLIGVYLLGAGALLLRLIVGTIRASRLTSDSCTTPVTVGVLRPRVILPNHWREWPQVQLDAILTHEQAHARRRDPLVQWLALLNRALFWFHPLAWWLERRLSALAEEACDAAVLAHGHDPRSYSEYLLDMARAVQRAGVRVHVTGMAMPGSYLPQRIRKMIAGIGASRVSPARTACAAVACVICSAMFAAGTLEHVTPIQLRPIPYLDRARPERLVAQAQLAPAARPTFEAATIKPCKSESGGRGGARPSPGRLNLNCQSLESFIRTAYVVFADGHVNPSSIPISGGPAWIHSDQYEINAKGFDDVNQGTMHGPMLQALLEDRFKLKIRREVREVPVYALTVAKGGPKLQQFKEGSCVPIDFAGPVTLPNPFSAANQKFCRDFASLEGGRNMALEAQGISIDNFVKFFLGHLDRPVINRTGITGLFDIHLVYVPSETGSNPADGPSAMPMGAVEPSIFAAVQQQLGLKLESSKGPGEFLFIDHVERPSEN